MVISRYSGTKRVLQGRVIGTSSVAHNIFDAVSQGRVPYDVIITAAGDRLDTIAGKRYGDGRLWWVIASASGVGWAPQVPPGTVLRVPLDLASLSEVL